jgi:predicted Fe-S protein YdhL (DUF1289 family)
MKAQLTRMAYGVAFPCQRPAPRAVPQAVPQTARLTTSYSRVKLVFFRHLRPVTQSQSSDIRDTESPCSKVCTLGEDDICLGCLRSLDEIGAWGSADRQERLQILDNAAAREQTLGYNNAG